MPVTSIGGAPYPAPEDADNVPADMQALAEWASTRVTMSFADAAARDAQIPAPTPGMVAWLDTPGALTIVSSSGAWRTVWSKLAWVDIALNTGYEAYGTTPQAAVESGLFIVLKGGVRKSGGGDLVATDVVGSIPSSLGTPHSGDFPIAIQWSVDNSARLYVGSDRTLQYIGENADWMALNGVRIPLD